LSERAWHSSSFRLWFSLVHLVFVCKRGVTVIVRVVFGVAVGGTSGVNSVVGCCLCEGWMPMQLIDAYLGLFGSVLSSVYGGAGGDQFLLRTLSR
jgi:hypothetical protein